MNKHTKQLLQNAYASTHLAADDLSALWVEQAAHNSIDLPDVREVLVHLRQATAAVQSLENLLAGNPEPKRGE